MASSTKKEGSQGEETGRNTVGNSIKVSAKTVAVIHGFWNCYKRLVKQNAKKQGEVASSPSAGTSDKN